MSVENISLFNSVLDEALECLGKKNLKLKESQYEAVKAVVVDQKDTTSGYGKSLIYQLLPYCGLLNLFICNACAVQATYSFLYVDHRLSQSLIPKDCRLLWFLFLHPRPPITASCKGFICLFLTKQSLGTHETMFLTHVGSCPQ